MTDIHKPLLEKVTEVLDADSRVLAAWLEGSIARKEDDDLSDIDLWIVVRDSDFDSFVAQRERFAAKLGSVISVLYPKTPGQPDELDSFQILFDDFPVTCRLDVDVQKQSRQFRFTTGSAAEECTVLFDKAQVIRSQPFDAQAVEQYTRELFEDTVTRFWHLLPKVLVFVERGNLLSAYDQFRERLHDLVTLQRIVYTPEKADWGWKDIEVDLPKEALTTLESFSPSLSAKPLRKQTRALAEAFDMLSGQISSKRRLPLPKPLIRTVQHIL